MSKKGTKRFKIALSFPGERRDFVEKIAKILCRKFAKNEIFYDKHFEAELARPDLDTYLQDIYHHQSELIVVFLCKEYEKKEWCGLEWRAIRDLIKQRKTSDIMPFRFDLTHIAGLFSIDGYIDINKRSPEEIAELICERYTINQQGPSEPPSSLSTVTTGSIYDEPIKHNLPYTSIGNLFKGRDTELAKLTSQLIGEKPIAITQAIEGLGGIGKTRLAIEFGWWAWENKRCRAVFFVSAETPEKLRASLASLAGEKMLALPGQKEDEQVASVMRWLMANSGWLMILDNADTEDAAIAVEDILPSLANGFVIITSRYTRWSGAVRAQQLGLLEPQQAKQFLLDRTATDRIKSDSDEEIAERMSKELGYLPLALEQAAAYIAHNKCTLAEYIEEWENERQQVLKWYNKRQMKYDVSVAVTWQRTFEQLKPSARTLLRLAAFLAPEMIPADMFKDGIEVANRAAELQCKEMKLEKAKFELKEALSELAAYSMITRQQKGFTVHRIVQEVIRSRIPEADQKSWLKLALEIVNKFAPTESDDVRTWPVLDVLRPHAELVAGTADHAGITEPTSRLMSILGSYLYTKGLYHKAEQLMERSLKIDEASFGPDHPNVAIDLNNLAGLLKATNRLSEAENLYRQALQIRKKSLGDKHPDYATSLNDLANLLKDTNRLSEAEPLYYRVLEIYEESFGKEHPWVATALNNLAQLLKDTNHLNQAEPLMRRALKIDESSFGPDHPKVAIRLNNLAQLLQATNRLDQAEPLMRRALKIFEDSLGPDHPNTQTVRNNLKYLK